MLRDGISLEDALRVDCEDAVAQLEPEPEPEAADDPLRTLLVEHKLEKYYDALVALGAALPDDLPELEPSDLDQIGMAKLERKRLARCVAGLQGGAAAAGGAGEAEDDAEEGGAEPEPADSADRASQSLKNSLATREFFVEQGLPTDTIDAEIAPLRGRVARHEANAA